MLFPVIQACKFVSLESLLTFATDSGVCIAFGGSVEDLRYAFADLLHSDRRSDFFSSLGFHNQEQTGDQRQDLMMMPWCEATTMISGSRNCFAGSRCGEFKTPCSRLGHDCRVIESMMMLEVDSHRC